MSVFTRWSRASTLQMISARLSKNGTMVTFASDTSLPRHTSTSFHWWLRRCSGSVFRFLRTILGLVAETATVSLQTLAFFFPLVTGTFFLWRLSVPFDSLSLLLNQISRGVASKFRNRSFWFVPLFTMVFNFWLLGTDVFWWIYMSYNSNTVLSCAGLTYSQICTDSRRHHRMVSLTQIVELRPILNRIPECCHHEEWQRLNQHNPIAVSWAPVTRKQS